MTAKRPLNVLITLRDGEHRIQVNGDEEYISQIVTLSKGFLTRWRYDLASEPEQNWRELRDIWRNAEDNVANQALSLFREAQRTHLREHPNCPHQDIANT